MRMVNELIMLGAGLTCLLLVGLVISPNRARPDTPFKGDIPPIDASAPVQTETATFALG